MHSYIDNNNLPAEYLCELILQLIGVLSNKKLEGNVSVETTELIKAAEKNIIKYLENLLSGKTLPQEIVTQLDRLKNLEIISDVDLIIEDIENKGAILKSMTREDLQSFIIQVQDLISANSIKFTPINMRTGNGEITQDALAELRNDIFNALDESNFNKILKLITEYNITSDLKITIAKQIGEYLTHLKFTQSTDYEQLFAAFTLLPKVADTKNSTGIFYEFYEAKPFYLEMILAKLKEKILKKDEQSKKIFISISQVAINIFMTDVNIDIMDNKLEEALEKFIKHANFIFNFTYDMSFLPLHKELEKYVHDYFKLLVPRFVNAIDGAENPVQHYEILQKLLLMMSASLMTINLDGKLLFDLLDLSSNFSAQLLLEEKYKKADELASAALHFIETMHATDSYIPEIFRLISTILMSRVELFKIQNFSSSEQKLIVENSKAMIDAYVPRNNEARSYLTNLEPYIHSCYARMLMHLGQYNQAIVYMIAILPKLESLNVAGFEDKYKFCLNKYLRHLVDCYIALTDINIKIDTSIAIKCLQSAIDYLEQISDKDENDICAFNSCQSSLVILKRKEEYELEAATHIENLKIMINVENFEVAAGVIDEFRQQIENDIYLPLPDKIELIRGFVVIEAEYLEKAFASQNYNAIVKLFQKSRFNVFHDNDDKYYYFKVSKKYADLLYDKFLAASQTKNLKEVVELANIIFQFLKIQLMYGLTLSNDLQDVVENIYVIQKKILDEVTNDDLISNSDLIKNIINWAFHANNLSQLTYFHLNALLNHINSISDFYLLKNDVTSSYEITFAGVNLIDERLLPLDLKNECNKNFIESLIDILTLIIQKNNNPNNNHADEMRTIVFTNIPYRLYHWFEDDLQVTNNNKINKKLRELIVDFMFLQCKFLDEKNLDQDPIFKLFYPLLLNHFKSISTVAKEKCEWIKSRLAEYKKAHPDSSSDEEEHDRENDNENEKEYITQNLNHLFSSNKRKRSSGTELVEQENKKSRDYQGPN